jgi:polysaccharide biosynthesis transport protein
MPDMIEEQESTHFDAERYIDLARRRHIYFLVPVFVGWMLVWGISWILPARYKSSTLILVEQPTMPENYVAPNVTDNLQDRLQSITQQILSRTRLLMIIEKLNLYSGADTIKNQDDKIEKLRKDIGIDLVRDTRNNEITSFRVSFSSHNPVLAQKVTNELPLRKKGSGSSRQCTKEHCHPSRPAICRFLPGFRGSYKTSRIH